MVNVLNRPEMLTLDSDKDELPPIPALKGDEEVKIEPEKAIAETTQLNPKSPEKKNNRNRIKNLDSKKYLTRLPVLLAQIKVWLKKLRNKIRQILFSL